MPLYCVNFKKTIHCIDSALYALKAKAVARICFINAFSIISILANNLLITAVDINGNLRCA